MNTPEGQHLKKPLRWAWYVVPPVLLLTSICIVFGPHIWRQTIIRRLENQGVEILYSAYHVKWWLETIPGLEHYQDPVTWVKVTSDRTPGIASEQFWRDVRSLGGNLVVDLSQSQSLNRDLERVPLDHVPGRLIDIEIISRNIDAAVLRSLEKVTDLRSLNLNGCHFEAQALNGIDGLKQLSILELDGSSITDEDASRLKGLINLRSLSLSNTQVSDAVKEDLVKALPKLQLSDD
jgi:Leucine-rich repeat (LRR) protein